jgi:hypothetical protein
MKILQNFHLVVLSFLGLLLINSCSDNKMTDVNDTYFIFDECETFTPSWIKIGPEGGTVAYSDQWPENLSLYPNDGVKIVIPEGSFEVCTEVNFNRSPGVFFWLFPDGFKWWVKENNIGGFKFNIGGLSEGEEHDRGYYQLWFPIQDIVISGNPCQSSDCQGFRDYHDISSSDSTGMLLCAYYWDVSADRYRIVLPKEINDSTMVVEPNSFHSLWSWGLVSLYDVDSEGYLRPLMEDLAGEEEWSNVLTEIETVLDTTILASNFDAGCIAMMATRSVFEGLYLGIEDQLAGYLFGMSPYIGDCSLVVLDPYVALKDALGYWVLTAVNVLVQLANLATDMVGGADIISYVTTKFFETAAANASCDYSRLYEVTVGMWPEFWGYYALRCFYYVMIKIIDWAVMDSGAINCPTWTPSEIDW